VKRDPTSCAWLPILCAALLAGPASSAPAAPVQGPVQEQGEKIERLEAWPELKGDEKSRVETDVARLRKARTPEMAEQAEDALVGGTEAAIPLLLAVLGKERDEDALERVERVLERMVSARHTRLLAREFGDRSLEVRVWTLRKCGQLPDEGVREAAEKALERVREQGQKADAEERYGAALCVTSSGSTGGLEELKPWAKDHWGKRGGELRAALEAVRGPEATKKLVGELASEDREVLVATLNMLAGCGEREVTGRVKPFLDNNDNSIRIAAINALRGIVDGDPPIDKLPVFEAIERAKQWKSRS
jgi:hypothetical protein